MTSTFLCITSLPFQQDSFGFHCSQISCTQSSKKEEIRHKRFGSQAAPSVSHVDQELKTSTRFGIRFCILRNQPSAQLRSPLPARGDKAAVQSWGQRVRKSDCSVWFYCPIAFAHPFDIRRQCNQPDPSYIYSLHLYSLPGEQLTVAQLLFKTGI